MNKNNNKMDLLGNAPVPQALMALGIPIMIGMLINALYNLVDAYFIGGLGESQMGAISIAFPLGQVVVGLGLMFGNGAASYLSRLLGRGDREAASKVASTALYSSVCIGAVIIIGTAMDTLKQCTYQFLIQIFIKSDLHQICHSQSHS